MISLYNGPRTFKNRPVSPRYRAELTDRHHGVPGVDPIDHSHAHFGIIGAGGIGANVAAGAAKKGVRTITVIDHDPVALSNCNRTEFEPKHVDQNKAITLGRILKKKALLPLTIHSYPYRWQEYLERTRRIPRFDCLIVAVDNNPTRRAASIWGHYTKTPVIHAAIARNAMSAYTSVQVPGGACWGCQFPEYQDDQTFPCGTPSIVDVLNIVSGYVLAAADSLVSARPREWNRKVIHVSGALPDRTEFIEPRPGCPICSTPPQLPIAA